MPRQKGNGSTAWRDPAGIEAAAPEQRLLAALIRQAVHDARCGDLDARDWLVEDACGWLLYLLPDQYNPDDIHRSLLHAAGCDLDGATA